MGKVSEASGRACEISRPPDGLQRACRVAALADSR